MEEGRHYKKVRKHSKADGSENVANTAENRIHEFKCLQKHQKVLK